MYRSIPVYSVSVLLFTCERPFKVTSMYYALCVEIMPDEKIEERFNLKFLVDTWKISRSRKVLIN